MCTIRGMCEKWNEYGRHITMNSTVKTVNISFPEKLTLQNPIYTHIHVRQDSTKPNTNNELQREAEQVCLPTIRTVNYKVPSFTR